MSPGDLALISDGLLLQEQELRGRATSGHYTDAEVTVLIARADRCEELRFEILEGKL